MCLRYNFAHVDLSQVKVLMHDSCRWILYKISIKLASLLASEIRINFMEITLSPEQHTFWCLSACDCVRAKECTNKCEIGISEQINFHCNNQQTTNAIKLSCLSLLACESFELARIYVLVLRHGFASVCPSNAQLDICKSQLAHCVHFQCLTSFISRGTFKIFLFHFLLSHFISELYRIV